MNDILPDATATWSYLEAIVKDVIESYGYQDYGLTAIYDSMKEFAREKASMSQETPLGLHHSPAYSRRSRKKKS